MAALGDVRSLVAELGLETIAFQPLRDFDAFFWCVSPCDGLLSLEICNDRF